MKKLMIMAAIAPLAFTACRHEATCGNTVTITDGQGSFLECSGPLTEPTGITSSKAQQGVDVTLTRSKPGSSAEYSLAVYSATGEAFVLDIHYAYAAAPGAGEYKLIPQDTNVNTYTDFFSHQVYKITDGTVQITNAASTSVTGTFTLNTVGAAGRKTITGTINATQPHIIY
jgi:hypothetical protein